MQATDYGVQQKLGQSIYLLYSQQIFQIDTPVI